MDAAAWWAATWQLLHQLTDQARSGIGPWILLVPLSWGTARIAVLVAAGIDLRRTMRLTPPRTQRWEGASALGHQFKIVQAGPGREGQGPGGGTPPPDQFSATIDDFVHKYWNTLERRARGLTRSAGDPEELLGEALLVLVERWDDLVVQCDDKKVGFLYTTMANKNTDVGRAKPRFVKFARRLLAGSPRTAPSAEVECADRNLESFARAELERVLAAMPAKRAQILRHHYAGHSNEEIAELLKKTPGAVATALSRGRKDVIGGISEELFLWLGKTAPRPPGPGKPPPDGPGGLASRDDEEGNR